jgi:hypothetical protein
MIMMTTTILMAMMLMTMMMMTPHQALAAMPERRWIRTRAAGQRISSTWRRERWASPTAPTSSSTSTGRPHPPR